MGHTLPEKFRAWSEGVIEIFFPGRTSVIAVVKGPVPLLMGADAPIPPNRMDTAAPDGAPPRRIRVGFPKRRV